LRFSLQFLFFFFSCCSSWRPQITSTKTLPLGTVPIKAAGHAKGNVSNAMKPDQAAENASNVDSPAKAMKSVFVGARASRREVASAALRNLPKNLYRPLQNEDGISEPKESRKKKGTNRASLFCFAGKPPKVAIYNPNRYFETNALQSDH
jgi:hypothetical protein